VPDDAFRVDRASRRRHRNVQLARVGQPKWKRHSVERCRGEVAVDPSPGQSWQERPAAIVEKIQGSCRFPDAVKGLIEVQSAESAARDAMAPSFADRERALGVRKGFWRARTHADIVPEHVFHPPPFSTGRAEVRKMAASSLDDAATIRTSAKNDGRE
jgi:hypothetical protein